MLRGLLYRSIKLKSHRQVDFDPQFSGYSCWWRLRKLKSLIWKVKMKTWKSNGLKNIYLSIPYQTNIVQNKCSSWNRWIEIQMPKLRASLTANLFSNAQRQAWIVRNGSVSWHSFKNKWPSQNETHQRKVFVA